MEENIQADSWFYKNYKTIHSIQKIHLIVINFFYIIYTFFIVPITYQSVTNMIHVSAMCGILTELMFANYMNYIRIKQNRIEMSPLV